MQGYVHVYTGNGKGKTTAAIGLAIRAVGAGKQVYIGQFAKSKPYSELTSLKQFSENITVHQYGAGCFIFEKPKAIDIEQARAGLKDIEDVSLAGKHDVVILDEANIAVYYNLFSVQELIEVIQKRADGCEIIITGRYATPEIMEYAHLVTEMREVKHYYQQGVQARVGIEK